MKINDRGFGPIGQPDPAKDPASTQRKTGSTAADSGFSLAEAGKPAPLTAPPGATRADLDDPSRLDALVRSSISQTLEASPLTAQLSAAHRQKLESYLASDPSMRGLVTRFLEGTLR